LTATPTPTPTPTGFHDAELRKINGAPQVPLPNSKGLTVKVRNNSDHTENIGVYVDIVPPGGITNPFGCTPFGRVIETVVTVAPTQSVDVTVTLSFDCADRAGAQGQSYTVTAVADDHADDLGACGPGMLMSVTCFNALADDDSVASNNRLVTNLYQVK